MPTIDYYEASIPTAPADVYVGDLIAVSGSEAHHVVAKSDARSPGATLPYWRFTLQRPDGSTYPCCRSLQPLPVVNP